MKLRDAGAIVLSLCFFAVAARWAAHNKEVDRHSLYCLGICSHVQENETIEPDPNEPGDEHREQQSDIDIFLGTNLHHFKHLDVAAGTQVEETGS